MNLVIGATGMLGYEICRLLIAEGKPVRAMVRKPFSQGKTKKLRETGVQIVQGDLCKKNTFGPALKGVTHIIATASSVPYSYIAEENDIHSVDNNGMMDLINHAAQEGVSHFIYTSFSGNISLDFPLRNAKRTVEQHLRGSGMTFTILRPGFFIETWLSPAMGFDLKKGKIQIYGTGKHPVSYISYFDVARFAVLSLFNPYARNMTLELGGPDKLSQFEIASLYRQISGKKIEIYNTPEDKLRAQMNTSLDPMQKSLNGLKLALAQGDEIDMTDTLKAFRIRLKSVREYAQIASPIAG